MISSGDTVVRSDELSVGPFGERFEIAQRGGFVDALVAHERRPQRPLASYLNDGTVKREYRRGVFGKSGAFSELSRLIAVRTMAASHEYAGETRPAGAVR
jgi:hypothetical protein